MADLLEQIEPLVAEMRKEVMDDLGRRVTPLVDRLWAELAPEIAGLERALEQANAWRVQDEPGAIYLKMACSILAMYRVLLPLFGDKEELLDVLKTVIDTAAFKEGMEAFLLNHFGISPDAPEEAWGQICANFVKRGQERYGRAWIYEQGIRDQKRCFINIRKCGFADFFLENGAREVLFLLCATDYVWGDALEKYRIRFERPTTLSEGSDACRFQLFKMNE